MQMSSLKDSFISFCEKNNFEKNKYQLEVLGFLIEFLDPKKIF